MKGYLKRCFYARGYGMRLPWWKRGLARLYAWWYISLLEQERRAFLCIAAYAALVGLVFGLELAGYGVVR